MILADLKTGETFKIGEKTYQVFLHPLCHYSTISNGQTLCINLGTQLMEYLPRKTKVPQGVRFHVKHSF